MRRVAKPRTLREQYEVANAADRHYALLSGKPAAFQTEIAPIRKRAAPKPSGEPTEAQILKAIMQLLNRHPKVSKVWRQNSGTFQMQYGDKTRYVRANTAKGMSDIMGILKDGRTLCIEVKTRTGKVQPHQTDFLIAINKAGGIAFVARSVDDVLLNLGGK